MSQQTILEKRRKLQSQRLPKKVLDAFNKLVIHKCSMCEAFLGHSEWKQFEGVCKRHWDY